MSVKAINSLSHHSDRDVSHLHSGAPGGIAMISFGAVYCLVPWL